jgi:hypothetical protein
MQVVEKEAVRSYWNAAPCGQAVPNSLGWFHVVTGIE